MLLIEIRYIFCMPRLLVLICICACGKDESNTNIFALFPLKISNRLPVGVVPLITTPPFGVGVIVFGVKNILLPLIVTPFWITLPVEKSGLPFK